MPIPFYIIYLFFLCMGNISSKFRVSENERGVTKTFSNWHISFWISVIIATHNHLPLGCPSPSSMYTTSPICPVPGAVLFCMGVSVIMEHGVFSHFVLIFTSTSSASSGTLQKRYPSKLQVAFSVLLSAILKFKMLFIITGDYNKVFIFHLNFTPVHLLCCMKIFSVSTWCTHAIDLSWQTIS